LSLRPDKHACRILGVPNLEASRLERVEAVVADLRRLVPAAASVQMMGPPGAHVLLRLRLRQPTRFLTDLQFFVWTSDARIQALRREFIDGLEAGQPAAIVLFPGRSRSAPYARVNEFPALTHLLERDYVIAFESDGHRIYTRRGG
jgi:hypothetical protein